MSNLTPVTRREILARLQSGYYDETPLLEELARKLLGRRDPFRDPGDSG